MFSQKRLRRARLEREFTLEEAANLLKIHPASLWRLENGKAQAKADFLIRCAEVFGKPVSYFFQDSAERTVVLSLECCADRLKDLYSALDRNADWICNWEHEKRRIEKEIAKTK